MRAPLSAVIAAVFVFAGCAGPAETPEPAEPMPAESDTTAMAADPLDTSPSLAGTEWRLIEFQSMDDTMEQPQDTVRYTMSLGADGRVAMQFNCNRGSGTWSAEPSAGAEAGVESGTFAFGPIAMTRALCPTPSMDEKIARDAEYIRGYYLRSDTLSLSLMADGGIYRWVPAERIPQP